MYIYIYTKHQLFGYEIFLTEIVIALFKTEYNFSRVINIVTYLFPGKMHLKRKITEDAFSLHKIRDQQLVNFLKNKPMIKVSRILS